MKFRYTIALLLISVFIYGQKPVNPKRVTKNGKYGFVNQRGDTLVKPVYDYAEEFSDGLALIRKNRTFPLHFQYLDNKGKIIINCDSLKTWIHVAGTDTTWHYWGIEEAGSFHDGMALVSVDDMVTLSTGHQYTYLIKKTKSLMPGFFYFATGFENGYGRVFLNGKYYRVDPAGNKTPFNADTCDCFDGFKDPNPEVDLRHHRIMQFPRYDRGQSSLEQLVQENQFFSAKNTFVDIFVYLNIDRSGHIVDYDLRENFQDYIVKGRDFKPDVEKFIRKLPLFSPANIDGVPFCSRLTMGFIISDNKLKVVLP